MALSSSADDDGAVAWAVKTKFLIISAPLSFLEPVGIGGAVVDDRLLLIVVDCLRIYVYTRIKVLHIWLQYMSLQKYISKNMQGLSDIQKKNSTKQIHTLENVCIVG